MLITADRDEENFSRELLCIYWFEIVSHRNEITKIIIDNRSVIGSDSLESQA